MVSCGRTINAHSPLGVINQNFMAKKKATANDLLVEGNKINGIDSITNDEGFFEDKFGNTIYATDSKENQDRLKKLKEKETKKKTKKKTTKKKATKKKG